MLLRHHGGAPSDHVIKYSRGRPVLEGRGLDVIYFPFLTKVASIPTNSIDARLRFGGWTSDYQRVKAEVDLVFRIASPRKAIAHFDFTVKRRRRGKGIDHSAILKRRVLGVARCLIADEVSRMPVRRAEIASAELGRSVKIRMGYSRLLADMGVTVLGVHVKSVECSPEVAEAIEAEHLRPVLLAGEAGGSEYLMTTPSRKSTGKNASSPTVNAPSIECTDSCPFRHLCEDYMRDIRDGRAWCTLFHEFPT